MRTGENVTTFYAPTRLVHGAGSARETGREFKGLGCRRALIVTDKGVRGAGLLDGVAQSLTEAGVSSAIFDDVVEDPSGADVGRGAQMAVEEKCDGIVVVGGGSPICAARGIGVVVANGGRIRDYAGLDKAPKAPLPLIAIPTTAGSGAEVSQFILLKDEETHTKMVVGSPLNFPKVAILDPLLLRGLPARQAVVSGIDALSHAIEAYCTSMATPITDALALQACSMLYRNLRAAAFSDDLDAKEACLIASSLANMACGNARLGLTHAMTVPLEGMFKVPHGIAIGVLLPHVMDFNVVASHARFASLAEALGGAGRDRSLEERARRSTWAVRRLLADVGFPRRYRDSEVDRKTIPEMAQMTMCGLYGVSDPAKEYPLDAVVPSVNVRKATIADLIRLYEQCFEEWDAGTPSG